MAGTADVVVRFIGDTNQLDNDLKNVEKSTTSVGNSFKGLARTAATAFGGIAIGALVRDSTDAAADLADQIDAVRVVFGDSAGTIKKWSKTTSDNLAITQTDALKASIAFATLGKAGGVATEDLAKFSTDLVQRAGDVASLYGGTAKEAVEAFGSALRGEFDPIEKYGVKINEAAVKAKALSLGLVTAETDTTKLAAAQLTASRAQDAYNTAVKEHGVNSKEAADKAAALEIANARVGEAAEGTVPQLTDQQKAAASVALIMDQTAIAQGNFGDTADSASNQQKRMNAKLQEAEVALGQALLPILQIVTPWIVTLADAFKNAPPSIQNATVALAGFAAVALAIGGPVGAIVAALGAIVVAAYLVWTNWDKIWNWIKDHPAYAVIFAILAAPIAWFILIIGALKTLYDNWDRIWGAISDTVQTARNVIVGAFNTVVGFFEGLPGRIAGAVAGIFGILVAPFVNAYEAIVAIPGQIAGAFSGLAGLILGAVGSLYHVGVQIMESLLNGIESVVGRIKNKIASVAGDIAGALNPFGSPQTKAFYTGQNVMRDYLAGVESIAPRVQRAMSSIGGELTPALAGGGSSSTYNISVSVAAGAAPAQVGAAVVDQIRAYERLNGKAWRT